MLGKFEKLPVNDFKIQPSRCVNKNNALKILVVIFIILIIFGWFVSSHIHSITLKSEKYEPDIDKGKLMPIHIVMLRKFLKELINLLLN